MPLPVEIPWTKAGFVGHLTHLMAAEGMGVELVLGQHGRAYRPIDEYEGPEAVRVAPVEPLVGISILQESKDGIPPRYFARLRRETRRVPGGLDEECCYLNKCIRYDITPELRPWVVKEPRLAGLVSADADHISRSAALMARGFWATPGVGAGFQDEFSFDAYGASVEHVLDILSEHATRLDDEGHAQASAMLAEVGFVAAHRYMETLGALTLMAAQNSPILGAAIMRVVEGDLNGAAARRQRFSAAAMDGWVASSKAFQGRSGVRFLIDRAQQSAWNAAFLYLSGKEPTRPKGIHIPNELSYNWCLQQQRPRDAAAEILRNVWMYAQGRALDADDWRNVSHLLRKAYELLMMADAPGESLAAVDVLSRTALRFKEAPPQPTSEG